MTAPPRLWPAADLRIRDGASVPPGFGDTLALVLDDVEATAVEGSELERAWRVHFADAPARDAALSPLREALQTWVDVSSIDVEDEGWVIRVQEDLKSVRVERIVVAPPWDVPATVAPGDIVLVIEPSMGFGTGHHQSTRLCLALLQRLPLDGLRVVDVGTGSGVLALAALRLGASDVEAIDNDGDSVDAATDNVARNGAGSAVHVHRADVADHAIAPGGVVIANLTAWLLRRYRDALVSLVAPGGRLLTSGFTVDQVPHVIESFPELEPETTLDEEDWVGMTFRRP